MNLNDDIGEVEIKNNIIVVNKYNVRRLVVDIADTKYETLED